jgi:hypothetical protein
MATRVSWHALISLLLLGTIFMGGAWAAKPLITKGHAQTALPMARVYNAGEVVPLANGDILVTDIGNLDRTGGKVLIADRAGHLLWQYKGRLDVPHSAYPTPNGDILITDTGDNRVIEVNRQSQIVWDSDYLGNGHGRLGQGRLSDGTTLSYPNDAKELPNGLLLISLRLQNRVVEITRTGRIVWDCTGFLHRQHNPHRLPNGDTLIADSDADRVIEVGQRGKHIVWQFGGKDKNGDDILSWPRDATPLPNGDILIADSNHNRIIEVTRSKRIVREWNNLPHVYSVAPLSNGDILTGDGATYGVVELTPQNKIVWTLNHPSLSADSGGNPLPTHIINGGFEQTVPGSTWMLADWSRNDALAYSVPPGKRVDMARDRWVHHSGHYSARISYEGDSNGIFFDQIVRVFPGHRYQFSGWIMTRNVRTCYPCGFGPQTPPGHTAEYELQFFTRTGVPPPAPSLPAHSGTSKTWIHDTVTFVVPPGVTELSVQPTLRGQGTVWFDDVSLKDLGP